MLTRGKWAAPSVYVGSAAAGNPGKVGDNKHW